MGADPKQEHVHGREDSQRTVNADTDTEQAHSPAFATPAGQAIRIANATLAAAPSSPGLAAPPRVDLGDRAVGTTHFEDLNVFNVEANDAYVRVSYEGSSSVVLVSAPSRLRPSKDGLDPAAAIRLAFSPAAKGRVHGTVVVHAAWQNGARAPADLRIPVEAAAHEIGGKAVSEEEAEQKERDEQERNEALDRAQMERATQAADRRLDDPKLANHEYGTAAARQRLADAESHARDSLNALFENRRAGVETAKDEAAKFKRRAPEHKQSLLEQLAFAALDVATAGIAGALGKSLELALSKSVKVAEHAVPRGGRASASDAYSPSKAVIAFFTDSVKDVTKRAAKGGIGAVKPAHAAEEQHSAGRTNEGRQQPEDLEDPGPSSDALLAFFQTEKISLNNQHMGKATEVTQHARHALEPMLDADPKQAIAAMEGIAHAIADQASRNKPANVQAQASAMHWIEYVAQTSLGAVTAEQSRGAGHRARGDGASTTRIDGANAASNSDGAITAHDGLLDIEFEVDVHHPSTPARIVHARIEGVSNTLADRLARQPLLSTGIPVRAYSPEGLEVVRDEAGNVEYTDNTGAPGMPGNWFARKAGEPRGGRDAALRGARKLIENEIMSRSLGEVESLTPNDRNLKIDTDSDDT